MLCPYLKHLILAATLGISPAIGAEHRDDVVPDSGMRIFEGLPAGQDQAVDLLVNHEDLALCAAAFHH